MIMVIIVAPLNPLKVMRDLFVSDTKESISVGTVYSILLFAMHASKCASNSYIKTLH